MPSEEEDLVKKLSARLSGEIENLPKDETDHAFTVKIKGNRGHINLGHQTFNIKTTKHPPPEGSNRARGCPQCGQSTWRYTQLCMHCHYNLHHHDDVAAHEQARAHKEATTHQLLKLFAACVGVALLIFFISDYLPEPLKPWAWALTGVFSLLAFVIITSPNEQPATRKRNRHLAMVMDD
jgi:hypothetical protein